MIHYPPQPDSRPPRANSGAVRIPTTAASRCSTDDGVGGLQVMCRDGTWIDIVVPDDHVVVNLGDLMAIWTNDRDVLKPHRVDQPARR